MKRLPSSLKKLPTHPLTWATGGLALALVAILLYFSAGEELDRLQDRACTLKQKQHWHSRKVVQEKKILEQLKTASRDYIETDLEKLQFLTPEINKLQALAHAEPSNERYTSRLDFLKTEKNSLRFREQNDTRLDQIQEVEMLQLHPVEMNRDDLKKVLARIENIPIAPYQPSQNSPHLIIKTFDLVKKNLSAEDDVFIVTLEIIKRELINE